MSKRKLVIGLSLATAALLSSCSNGVAPVALNDNQNETTAHLKGSFHNLYTEPVTSQYYSAVSVRRTPYSIEMVKRNANGQLLHYTIKDGLWKTDPTTGTFGTGIISDPAFCFNSLDGYQQVLVRQSTNPNKLNFWWKQKDGAWVDAGFFGSGYSGSPSMIGNSYTKELECVVKQGKNYVHLARVNNNWNAATSVILPFSTDPALKGVVAHGDPTFLQTWDGSCKYVVATTRKPIGYNIDAYYLTLWTSSSSFEPLKHICTYPITDLSYSFKVAMGLSTQNEVEIFYKKFTDQNVLFHLGGTLAGFVEQNRIFIDFGNVTTATAFKSDVSNFDIIFKNSTSSIHCGEELY